MVIDNGSRVVNISLMVFFSEQKCNLNMISICLLNGKGSSCRCKDAVQLLPILFDELHLHLMFSFWKPCDQKWSNLRDLVFLTVELYRKHQAILFHPSPN